MLKITLETDGIIREVLVPESRTIRQVLTEKHISYRAGSVYINGLPIYMEGLDTPFSHMSEEQTHYVIREKEASGAEEAGFHTCRGPKSFVFGSACIIVSSLSAEEIRRMKAVSPELLQLRDENGEPYFAMDIEEGYGSIKEYGAVYGNQVTGEGKATITILLNPAEPNLANLIRVRLREALRKLVRLEGQILAAMGVTAGTDGAGVCPIYQV